MMLTLARTTIAIALLLALMLIGTIIGARAQQVTQNRPTSIALMDAECRWIFHPPQSSNSQAAILLNRCTGESYWLVGFERRPDGSLNPPYWAPIQYGK
jgi:hypothetical protein